MSNISDDPALVGAGLPDPHGQAALLLVESLIHALQERSILGIDDAIGVVETALEVQAEVAETADGAGTPMWRSHALLSAILESLRRESNGRPPTPYLVT